MSACTVADCKNEVRARGLCNTHRLRLKKYGDPLTVKNRAAGEGTPHIDGYWMFEINKRSVLRHVLIAEKALGRCLPKGAQVHHVDQDRSNDANANLVICQDAGYHRLLHQRQAAYAASGYASWRKCHICKKHDDPTNLKFYLPSGLVRHLECWRERYRQQKGVSR